MLPLGPIGPGHSNVLTDEDENDGEDDTVFTQQSDEVGA
jgi:hypothetical protein